MIRFYSRLPVPKLPFESDAHAIPDFSTASRLVPLAGLVVGLPGAAALWLGLTLGLPELLAAGVAVAVAVFSTGAFHEDGLADSFDGLGGGWTVERRLEIMKDSRIGSYGGAALMLALILRITALSVLVEATSASTTALVMLSTASLSRSLGLTPLALLPAARSGGFASTVGCPSMAAYGVALLLAIGLTGIGLILADLPLAGGLVGLGLASLLTIAMTWWSHRAIHGQTGDIAGACQQLAEIAFYCGLLIIVSDA